MACTILLLLHASFLLLFSAAATAAIVEHTFIVGNLTIQRVCGQQVKTVVNRRLPGPVIRVHEGDTLVVHVLNKSPYNMTLHWHGVFQLFSGWNDGPAYVTQCPILPKTSFTYKFNISGQEGTLWWHAHISMLRETVHGALIIFPRLGRSYPFPKPYKEVPIVLGEWYNANVVDLEEELISTGGPPTLSDALTINGQPGPFFPCSGNNTYKLNVVHGKTYLLRMINAVMENHLFFKLANHTFTVVAVDARYTEPYNTDVIVIAPGQSADVLFTANQPPGNYYMAAHPYSPTPPLPFANGTTAAIVHYYGANSSSSTPVMPVLPGFRDTETAHRFFTNITSLTDLTSNPHWLPVPTKVDEKMFITFGVGLEPCIPANCTTPLGNQYRSSSNMNNVSFQLPSRMSMLEAFYHGVKGIYTEDFPNYPPFKFDYTNANLSLTFPNPSLNSSRSLVVIEKKETRVKRLKYNSVVEVVLQNTALIAAENHPMHFHGFDFYVLAQGFGNYDPVKDPKKFNLVNPQERNTIAVPIAGWAVIRFRANNPGVWFVHCHRETHVPWGLNMAFIIENGPTPWTSLPPAPPDFPRC